MYHTQEVYLRTQIIYFYVINSFKNNHQFVLVIIKIKLKRLSKIKEKNFLKCLFFFRFFNRSQNISIHLKTELGQIRELKKISHLHHLHRRIKILVQRTKIFNLHFAI